MSLYSKIMSQVDKLVITLVIILMLILISTVFLNIFLRYIGYSILWADGVSRLVFVWLAFLGMYIGYRNNNHPSFKLLIKNISKKNFVIGNFFYIFIHLSVLIFLLILIFGGYQYISQAHVQNIAVLKISVGWKYSAGPVVGILMLLETIRKLISVLFSFKVGE